MQFSIQAETECQRTATETKEEKRTQLSYSTSFHLWFRNPEVWMLLSQLTVTFDSNTNGLGEKTNQSLPESRRTQRRRYAEDRQQS